MFGLRGVGSDDAELSLLGPGQWKVTREPGDGQVSRRAALGDCLNDAVRKIGERGQEPNVTLGQLFVLGDRAKASRGIVEDRLDPVPRPRNGGQQ